MRQLTLTASGAVLAIVTSVHCSSGGRLGSGAPSSTTPATGASSGELSAEAALSADDLAKTWVRVAAPHATQDAVVARTPDGFVALASEETPTGGKADGPRWSYLYRSKDGVTWEKVPSIDPPPTGYLGNADVFFGANRYFANYGGLWTSSDLAQWSNVPFAKGPGGAPAFWTIARADQKFFGLGPDDIWSSADGISWSSAHIALVQAHAIAYGNGVYVVAGALAIWRSTDGVAWEDHTPPCSTAGVTCVSPPGGGSTSFATNNAAFLDGQFYVDHLMSSDGLTWTHNPAPIANAALGGWLFKYIPDDVFQPDGSLRAWRAGESPRAIAVEAPATAAALSRGTAPSAVTTPLAGGETCADHRGVVLNKTLYLLR